MVYYYLTKTKSVRLLPLASWTPMLSPGQWWVRQRHKLGIVSYTKAVVYGYNSPSKTKLKQVLLVSGYVSINPWLSRINVGEFNGLQQNHLHQKYIKL